MLSHLELISIIIWVLYEEKLKKGFKKYLKEFRKATLNSDQKRYEKILKYSSLQYFKDRLQIK